ncbi:MAG TPA: hypothetical protein VK427_26405 [Kofleriaceae bacterium]|nr:hypothetical protein [Kofleriaceae bacterium]
MHDTTATCAEGCAVEVEFPERRVEDLGIAQLTAAPRVLCAETAEARVGDACKPDGTLPCLPTRAHLAADGTVTGQTYLACGANQTCATAPPPVISRYLEACDPAIVAEHGANGVNRGVSVGGVDACLLALNAATHTVASGRTKRCVGDWNCPAGSLCDDQVSGVAAVCKPGPRGMLSPAMLAPQRGFPGEIAGSTQMAHLGRER